MALINNDIVRLLNKAIKQSGKQTSDTEITYFCPFHVAKNDINRRKFGIDLETQKFNCFACGVKGRTFKNLFRKLNLSKNYFDELFSIIKDAPTDLNFENSSFIFKNDIKPFQKLNSLPDEFISLMSPNNSITYRHVMRYLRKRNITDIDILRYNIGYCDSGKYMNRIIFPSYNSDGTLNFFSGRDYTGNSSLRYLNCEFNKNIIGFESMINFKDELTIVEGPIDSITLRRNCIPLFGKFMSEKLKVAIVKNTPPTINILLDADALDYSMRICDFMSSRGIKTKIIKLIDGKDSSECGFKKTWNIIDSCGILSEGEIFKQKLGLKLW